MNNEQLRSEIRNIVAKIIKLPVEKVDPAANLFTELNVDSLLGVEIFAALDKKYGVNIPEEKLRGITTLNDIIELVAKQKK
jgi:acyl carrier protein